MASGSNLFTSHKARILAHTPNTTDVFLRGDNSWSNELIGGILKVTNNGTTLSLGAQNTEWTHIVTSTPSMPFYFNTQVTVDGALLPYTNAIRTLGDSSHKWQYLYVNNRVYLDEWIQFSGTTGLYFPNGNGGHFYPNTSSSYATFQMQGTRGGYIGILCGNSQDYMAVMDSGTHKGLYQETDGMWIVYYHKDTKRVGIRTSSLTNYAVTCEGDFYCRNGWLRTQGGYGWYNESYGGGWYMADSTWMRTYNNKSIYAGSGTIRTDRVCGGMWITGTHEAAFQVYANTSAGAGGYYQGWYMGKTPSGAWSWGLLSGYNDCYFVYGHDSYYNSGNNSVATIRFGADGKVYNAVWNDYAEYRASKDAAPGYVIAPDKDGISYKTSERLQAGARIISDTYGMAIGETDKAKVPVGLVGRVLAYPYRPIKDYQIGDCVCSAPNGTVDIMTREEIKEYPDRILGIVNEIPSYEIWDGTLTLANNGKTGNKIKVNGRIWIDIK